jgi:signal transduction histidine kinase
VTTSTRAYRRLLIVDDSPEDRERCKRMLRAGGDWVIVSAESGEEALKCCRKSLPACVLVDYQLPDMSGLEFIAALGELTTTPVPTIMLTGLGNEEIAVEAMRLGAHDYLVKDRMTPRGLAFTVARAVKDARLCRTVGRQTRMLEERNRDLRSLSSAAAHDLKEPLRLAQTFGNLLETQAANELSDEAKGWLSRMLNSLTHMRALVDGLLTLAEVSARVDNDMWVDLSAVAANFLDPLLCGQGASLRIVNELPSVFITRSHLEDLLGSMGQNALDHAPTDEPLVVEFSASQTLLRGRTALELTVSDNGSGFPENQAERLFDAFRHLDGDGAGIGLAICRQIAEHYNGSVSAESKGRGKGATFRIVLPIRVRWPTSNAA